MTDFLLRTRFSLFAFVLAMTTAVAVAADTTPAAADSVYCRSWEATIVGTDGPDEIFGTDGIDVIHGLGGDDIIHGLRGRDIICGGGGNDTIYGNQAADRLFGGGGDDELRGGRGNDRVRGKKGTDTLYGGSFADVCVGENETGCEVDYRGDRDEELWRHLVDEYFGDIGETDNALVIIACESNGDPFAVNPDGEVPKGLWQFIPSTWEWATPHVGWEEEHRFHPEAATATARWLYDWADGRYGGDGQGFDPWTHCRCLLPEYDCVFDATAASRD